MPKSKLLSALDARIGRNYKVEKQRKLQKQAAKKKESKAPHYNTEKENGDGRINGTSDLIENETYGWESDESEAPDATACATSGALDSESDSDSDSSVQPEDVTKDIPENVEEGKEDKDQGEDSGGDNAIPLSDIESLASDEKADILPHQRLTINNTSALQKAYKSIALPYFTISFSAHQTVTTMEPVAIPDVHDDLSRELAFYKQCLDATNQGRALLKKEGIPFSRPNDYFAEMVKNDEHMGKVKQKMVDEAANKRAAAEARKQRDLKRFGKQVQIAKLQERDKAKRDTLDKINLLKRKRKNMDTGAPHEEDLFDVALDNAVNEEQPSRGSRDKPGRGSSGNKKQKKDEKFGFGGKKRFSKSIGAASTADLKGFSVKKMKEKKGPQRLGKSRRAKL